MTDYDVDEGAGTTEFPCEECGVAVFQITSRRKRYCSKDCARRAWHRRNPKRRPSANNLPPLLNRSVTVTYTDVDGKQLSTVGVGTSRSDAREDADAQVPVWFAARGPLKTHAVYAHTILRSLRQSAS